MNIPKFLAYGLWLGLAAGAVVLYFVFGLTLGGIYNFEIPKACERINDNPPIYLCE